MNILITGANGQLGSELKLLSKKSQHNFYFTDVDELDIVQLNNLYQFINKKELDYVINCAAYTDVDKAESEQDKAFSLNQTAVKNLILAANKYNFKLIHISTDYVFDGKSHSPYSETHKTNPTSIYGKSKLAGEQEIRGAIVEAIIIRTAWLYSAFGKNFVKTMLKLAAQKDELNLIFDQVGTPTYAKDLAEIVLKIIDINNAAIFEQKEIYHFSNEGVCSWYDFARKIFTYKKLECKLHPIETIDYPTPAPRPHYSVLNKKKIKTLLQIEIPHWEESLEEMLDNI